MGLGSSDLFSIKLATWLAHDISARHKKLYFHWIQRVDCLKKTVKIVLWHVCHNSLPIFATFIIVSLFLLIDATIVVKMRNSHTTYCFSALKSHKFGNMIWIVNESNFYRCLILPYLYFKFQENDDLFIKLFFLCWSIQNKETNHLQGNFFTCKSIP